MPLIKCTECGKEYSSYAKACPNCACPTEVILMQTAKLQKSNGDVEESIPGVALQEKPSEEFVDFDLQEKEESTAEEFAGTAEEERMKTASKEPSVVASTPVTITSGEATVFYGVKKTLDPVTFYRDALLDMVADEGTPPDLFDASFDAAVESTKYLATFNGNVTGSYTAQIGYDMVRTWTEYKNGRAVERKENYIEWQPFAGAYSGRQTAYKSLVEDPLDEDIEIAYHMSLDFNDLLKEQIPTDDYLVPTQAQIQNAMDDCKAMAELECKDNLPGNHQKDYSFSGFAQPSGCICHTIPAYSVPFTYQGEQYKKSFFAMKEHEGASFGKIPEISDEIHATVDKKLRPLGIVALVFLSLSIVASLTFGILHEYVVRALGLAVSCPVFGIGVLSTIAYWIARKKYLKAIIRANLLAKTKAVDRVLVEKGLDPLSEEEKEYFRRRANK